MLSDIQNQIVNTISGPTLVVSCPGSGKTTVIVNRTYQMIQSGIRPENILVITFTKEAATEMETRFRNQFHINGVSFGTIHSLCFKILIQNSGYTKDDIMTGSEQYIFLATEMRKISGKIEEEKVKALMSNISYSRNLEIDPTLYVPEDSLTKDEFFSCFVRYQAHKEQIGKIDFDDMLFKTRELLEDDTDVLNYWQNKYSHIMVDEYQDTSMVQADICNMLAAKHRNLCVVGDDDQSIYRFRGAKVETILNFKNDYTDAQIFNMDVNYRSTRKIVKRASMLIQNNEKRYKKNFIASREDEGAVNLIKCKSSIAQAVSIFKEIEELHRKGIPYTEMAVLYRTNIQNQLLIPSLMKNKVPFYTTEAPVDIHDEFMYKDIFAYYRLANDIGSREDLLRILNRPTRYLKKDLFKDTDPTIKGILATATKLLDKYPNAYFPIKKLVNHLEQLKHLNPMQFCEYMEIYFSYVDCIRNYAEYVGKNTEAMVDIWKSLKTEAAQFSTMKEWQNYGLLYKEELAKVRKENHKKGVCLSTFHSSKGLEWRYVFIMDANEDTCPHSKAVSKDDYEEERRLFYVGVTRAKDVVNIYYVDDLKKEKEPSRYLSEMGLIKNGPSA